MNIAACDWLAELAAPGPMNGTCAELTAALKANPASKASRLTVLLTDTLRQIFGRQFAFLDWSAPAAPRWNAEVRLFQQDLGRPLLFQVVLRDNGAVRVTSEAMRFEDYGFDIVGLMGTQAATVIRDRWAARVDSLLAANGGVNRRKLVQAVFHAIPLADLDVHELSDQGRMLARVPVHDRDLRLDPTELNTRPIFDWKVESVIQGAVIRTQDVGVFHLGECQPMAAGGPYVCKMLDLQYGPRSLSAADLVEFFKSASLHPPKALFVSDYTPAAKPCGVVGLPPR